MSRIVLYIDDLDRCPEDKVIEVLRVVHLMLAFPLFVCFAAVDPRWVTECLRKAPGLIDHDHLPEKMFGRPATPADYLEKIFQIPLWLRPVPEAQRPAIVRALLEGPGAHTDPRDAAAVLHAATMADDAARLVAPDAAASSKPTTLPEHGAMARPEADLAIEPVELEYLDHLDSALSGNPRALKRFVNTYRLVKSALSDVELQVFHVPLHVLGDHKGTEIRYLPYRMCMAQLAVLSTQRERALEMVRLADSAAPGTKFGPWLKELEAKVDMKLSACFRTALTPASADLDQVDLSTFALWLERTRRYSFYL